MQRRAFSLKSFAVILATLSLAAASGSPAHASPHIGRPAATASIVEEAQIFQRGRPPVYPYYYAPRRGPNGWSFYFGPVPYQPGNIEAQALQRRYPQLNYPPSMRYWNPQTPF